MFVFLLCDWGVRCFVCYQFAIQFDFFFSVFSVLIIVSRFCWLDSLFIYLCISHNLRSENQVLTKIKSILDFFLLYRIIDILFFKPSAIMCHTVIVSFCFWEFYIISITPLLLSYFDWKSSSLDNQHDPDYFLSLLFILPFQLSPSHHTFEPLPFPFRPLVPISTLTQILYISHTEIYKHMQCTSII